MQVTDLRDRMAYPLIQRALCNIAAAQVEHRCPRITRSDRHRKRLITVTEQHYGIILFLLEKLRKSHPGVKFLLVSTKVWPNDDLGSMIKEIYDGEIAAGRKDLEYKHVFTSNVGLHGHPDTHSQEELANTLRPVIARLGRWLSR